MSLILLSSLKKITPEFRNVVLMYLFQLPEKCLYQQKKKYNIISTKRVEYEAAFSKAAAFIHVGYNLRST